MFRSYSWPLFRALGYVREVDCVVNMQEGISTIITAINRSRKIFRRIEAYIIYRKLSRLAWQVQMVSSQS